MRICDWKYKKESGQQNGSYRRIHKRNLRKIDSKKDYYAEISNKIWEFAEPRFQEYRSSELLQHVLKQAGFSIKADLAGEKTAFIAEYGSGKPVIAFLENLMHCRDFHRRQMQQKEFLQILVVVVMDAAISLSEQELLPLSLY